MSEALFAERGAVRPSPAPDPDALARRPCGAVWTQIVKALQGSDDLTRHMAADAARRAPGREGHAFAAHARVEVLERLSERTIVILWQDATRCRYVDQVWMRCQARQAGRCAITGAAIARDDIVYKPQRRGGCPSNACAMILAHALPELP